MTRQTTRRIFAGIACAAVALVGCSSDDDSENEESDESVEESQSGSGTETAESGEESDTPGVVEVVMSDFAYGGLPDTVAAGTQFAVTNTSEAELHEIVAIRLADDEQRSVEELLALPPGEAGFADPTTVLLAAPGGPQIAAVGDGTLAETGRYAVFCQIPTGVDPQVYLDAAETSVGPPDVPGGPPHFTEGMFAEVVVE